MNNTKQLKIIIIDIIYRNEHIDKDINMFSLNMELENIEVLCLKKEDNRKNIYSSLCKESTFLIIDNIESKNIAKEFEIGFCTYDNDYSKKYDWNDVLYLVQNISEMDYETVNRMLLRHLRLPWEILRTKRCLVREITEEDIDELYKLYEDKSLTEYMEDLFNDKEEELEYIRYTIDKQYRFYEFGIWLVESIEDGRIIGRAGIDIRDGYDAAELGFVISREYQNKGIAYEVMSAIIEYAKERLCINELNAFADLKNKKSVNLLKKLGFANVKDSFWKLIMV